MAWGEHEGDDDVVDKKSAAAVPPLQTPTPENVAAFRQIALAAFPDHVARRADNKATGQGMIPYECTVLTDQLVYIHPSSGDGVMRRVEPLN